MDRYQKYLLKKCDKEHFIFSLCRPLAKEDDGKEFYGSFDEAKDTFTLTQDENIDLCEYVFLVMKNDYPIEKVFAEKDGAWREIEPTPYRGNDKYPCFRIVADFRDRIERLRFCFKDNLADDYILNLKYVEADKDAYYAKIAEAERQRLLQEAAQMRETRLKNAAVKVDTGADLFNVYFQPCCDKFGHAELTLYRYGYAIARYTVEKDMFFKSVGGLAYGEYEIVLQQFGEDGGLLVETDKIKFNIRNRTYPVNQSIARL